MRRLHMISDYYKDSKTNFKVAGLCVLVQNLKANEVLFLKNSNPEKISKLVSEHIDRKLECFIVTTKKFDGIENYSHIILSDEEFEKNKAKMIDEFYPEKDVHYVGVTGTNGKTTTCWLLSELSRLQKKKPLYIGTLGAFYCGEKIISDFSTTTPSLLDLRKLIHKINDKIDIVILEVSSHALYQGRLKNIKLETSSWTNISQDHLDFHKSMDEYFAAKSKITEMVKDKRPIFFNENESELYERFCYDYKKKSKSFKVLPLDLKDQPVFFKVNYNQKNLELAVSMYHEVFSEEELSSIALVDFCLPPGRFEEITKENILFVIDYAHTPDALEKLLKEIKSIDPSRDIISVIGCGGNRDSSKRPLMAKASSENASITILTTDNPRDENPLDIIEDMKPGLCGSFEIICDRKEAIEKSFEVAKKSNAVVVIAGKGHETYQEVKGTRHYFSDREVIEKL